MPGASRHRGSSPGRRSGAAHSAAAYRADIDGLRALAVISVLLYHVDLAGVGGGFLGVDVFFVISGYLICGMIDAQLRAGTFSLADFYKRRILRIIPALTVMMLATTAFAYGYFLPAELKDYAFSLLAAAASVSNMYFSATAGYFDAPALTKPLLHTWSLGVEEQFYVATPLLMLLVARFTPRRMGVVLIVCAALSLALAAIGALYTPVKAFYYAPFRAWEFLLGALIAVGAVRLPESPRFRDAMSVLGLLMVLGVVLLGSSRMPFIAATGLASLGTALVIASTANEGRVSAAGRVLSWRPVAFIGLISYSVYLWHWPLVVFLRPGALLPDSVSLGVFQVIVIALSLILGALSWRFVERPFRVATPRTGKLAVFGTFSAATLVLGFLGAALIKLDGVPSRFSPEVVRIASYLGYDRTTAFRQGRCYLTGNRDVFDDGLCLNVAPDRPNYLLLGDSFAAHLWLGLSTAMPQANILQANVAACRPLIAASPLQPTPCSKLRERMFGSFLSSAGSKIDKVFLAAAWKDEDLPALASTIAELRARGLEVVVLGPLVEYLRPLPRLLVDGIRQGDPALARRAQDPTIPGRDTAMRALVAASGAEYVSLYAAACPHGVCQEFATDGVPMQFDTGHLTAEGSIALGRRLAGEPHLTH